MLYGEGLRFHSIQGGVEVPCCTGMGRGSKLYREGSRFHTVWDGSRFQAIQGGVEVPCCKGGVEVPYCMGWVEVPSYTWRGRGSIL